MYIQCSRAITENQEEDRRRGEELSVIPVTARHY
jgi:hypothetical protein